MYLVFIRATRSGASARTGNFPIGDHSPGTKISDKKSAKVENFLTDLIPDKPTGSAQGLIPFRPQRGYSARRACIGSMVEARRAGIQLASKAALSRTMVTARTAAKSMEAMP